MCGRFTLTEDWSFIEAYFAVEVSEMDGFQPRYNIAPTQLVPVILQEDGRRVARWMVWGLKTQRAGVLFNARAETLLERPTFRRLVPRRRCLVPADGFYEWAKRDDGGKQPYRIQLVSRRVFAFAGLYDQQVTPDGKRIWHCTIVTCAPNRFMARIHDRMPVILAEDAMSAWLDPALPPDAALALLGPVPTEEMTAYPVSAAVGNSRIDEPSLIRPLP
ncbi:MAG: SOS response-associated peptidase [Thermoflavifilum sp.]|nr:SOS response-associated peptidase [Thermoflavifilum sp.]MCL6514449.1 SOS response-associated peptidase [Alicyclobacillus sp.]